MLVFFDTTETYDSPTFRGAKWEKFARFFKDQRHRGVIPQIVLEETANHIREQFDENRRRAIEACRKLSELTGHSVSMTRGRWAANNPVENLTPLNVATVRSRIESLGLIVEDYNSCQVSDLVQRALARRKPFDGKGQRGFRDAVIWETILRVAARYSGDTVFITKNTKDFCVGSKLEPSLATEFEARTQRSPLTVYDGVDSFISQVVNPTLEKASQVVEELKASTYRPLPLLEFIRQHVDEIDAAIRDKLARTTHLIHGRHGHTIVGATLATPVKVEGVIAVDAYHIDESRLAVSATFEAASMLSGNLEIEFEWSSVPYLEETYVSGLFLLQAALVIDERQGQVVDYDIKCTEAQTSREPSPSIVAG